MIRFSHSANSWQVHIAREWIGVSASAARLFFDRGYRLVSFEQMTFENW